MLKNIKKAVINWEQKLILLLQNRSKALSYKQFLKEKKADLTSKWGEQTVAWARTHHLSSTDESNVPWKVRKKFFWLYLFKSLKILWTQTQYSRFNLSMILNSDYHFYDSSYLNNNMKTILLWSKEQEENWTSKKFWVDVNRPYRPYGQCNLSEVIFI